MDRIRAVEAIPLAAGGAQGAYGAPYGFLVKVTTQDGLTGWGEADSHPAMLKAVVEGANHFDGMSGLAAVLVGRDAMDTAGAWQAMADVTHNIGRDGLTRMAMAAVDIALWDIAGKAAGKPVHALLGRQQHAGFAWYGTCGLGPTLEATADLARGLKASGATAGKFGWVPLGSGSAADDEAIVATLRETLGPGFAILIDGGLAFDTERAIARARMMARYGVHWFEEALAPYDRDGYRRLRRVSPVTITAGEMASSAAELIGLIEHGCVDVVQIDLARIGITQGLRVAEAAARRGVACVNHTYTLGWNSAASLHLMAVIPVVDLFEVQVHANPLRDALTPGQPRLAGGRVQVPEGPRLGVEPEPAALARFAVVDGGPR